MIATVKAPRYFVRRALKRVNDAFQFNGWEICDYKKFDRIALYWYEDEATADAVCKLLNSNEEN